MESTKIQKAFIKIFKEYSKYPHELTRRMSNEEMAEYLLLFVATNRNISKEDKNIFAYAQGKAREFELRE